MSSYRSAEPNLDLSGGGHCYRDGHCKMADRTFGLDLLGQNKSDFLCPGDFLPACMDKDIEIPIHKQNFKSTLKIPSKIQENRKTFLMHLLLNTILVAYGH